MNASSMSEEIQLLYQPFQAKSADKAFKQFVPKVDQWVTSWNEDPDKRSKVGQLRVHLEETKEIVMDDLE